MGRKKSNQTNKQTITHCIPSHGTMRKSHRLPLGSFTFKSTAFFRVSAYPCWLKKSNIMNLTQHSD